MTSVEPTLPTEATLRTYGLTMGEWLAFIPFNDDGQRVCYVCWTPPRTGRYVVDHQHVPGWKRMDPDERKRYVRGVICTTCNHYILTRYGTPLKFRNAAQYLEDYERRRDHDS